MTFVAAVAGSAPCLPASSPATRASPNLTIFAQQKHSGGNKGRKTQSKLNTLSSPSSRPFFSPRETF